MIKKIMDWMKEAFRESNDLVIITSDLYYWKEGGADVL